jgi:apoptosis-inducing factor 2
VPGIVKDDQILQPIEPGFAQYPKESFEFVLGTAGGVDTTGKTAKISTKQGEKTLKYDYLVLATGARSITPGVPWKANGTYEECVELLHKTQERVKAANHIIIAGAGPTGVETSAELRFEFKDKDVVLLSPDPEILGGDSVASAVEREIVKLGVTVKKNCKVLSTTVLPDGKTELSLANGEVLTTDLYLPTFGLAPNTDYLDPKLLTERKYVHVDDYLRVKGAENVWACGDIVSKPRAGFMISDKQVRHIWGWLLPPR